MALSDPELDTPWAWRDYDEEGLRFAFFVAHLELQDLAAALADSRAHHAPPTLTQRILGQYHRAYRDLTGALAGVRDDELDRAPAADEWPLRRVVDHMLDAESGFATAIELALERDTEHPEKPSKAEWEAHDVPVRAEGDVAGVRDALFRSHVRVLRFASLLDDDLETPSHFWESEPYPIGFRLHRFEEHMRQHTIQADKTLVAIGHPPTEAERLVRLLYGALADVESASLGMNVAGNAVERTAATIAELADRAAARR